NDQRDGARRATRLGLAWGVGHGITLFGFGLPVILFRHYLPDGIQRGAELAIGIMIAALSLRLLWRWRKGCFQETHSRGEELGRSPLAAFGIGMAHGLGGSAGVGILLASAVSGRTQGVIALLIFAGATAASMALISTALGYALVTGAL